MAAFCPEPPKADLENIYPYRRRLAAFFPGWSAVSVSFLLARHTPGRKGIARGAVFDAQERHQARSMSSGSQLESASHFRETDCIGSGSDSRLWLDGNWR
jgi:hypothetical protein